MRTRISLSGSNSPFLPNSNGKKSVVGWLEKKGLLGPRISRGNGKTMFLPDEIIVDERVWRLLTRKLELDGIREFDELRVAYESDDYYFIAAIKDGDVVGVVKYPSRVLFGLPVNELVPYPWMIRK